ncbi:MAG TPA: VTC domain-containing protein [Dehalococcoidia bacterium]|nr:VTC domain-containing protein [Dehalococcoidia bacterium]
MSVVAKLRSQRLPRRGERRFLVDESMTDEILIILQRHPVLIAEDLSTPWRTTVYCDTPNWQIYRAVESGAGVLMRFREYHGTRPNNVFDSVETWLEFKPTLQFTGKTRFALPARSIPALLRGELQIEQDAGEPAAWLRQLLDAGVRPVFATQYHRLAYESADKSIRITADRDIRYLSLRQWNNGNTEQTTFPLGPVFATESNSVIEMKWRRALPGWAVTIAEFLEPYSVGSDRKFVVGARQLQDSPALRREAAHIAAASASPSLRGDSVLPA